MGVKETAWGEFVRCRLIEEGSGLRALVSPRKLCATCTRRDEGALRQVIDLCLRDRVRLSRRRGGLLSVEEAARRLAERLGKGELRRTLVQAVESGMPPSEAERLAAANGIEAGA
jgi:hypothetical protein